MFCTSLEINSQLQLLYQMDQDQYSNATRPSTNHHSYNRQQNQTNTSQHNPLLSAEKISEQNQIQNELQQVLLQQHQSQQLNNQKAFVEQKQLSASQRLALHTNPSEGANIANQQIQQSPDQHKHKTQSSQSYDNSIQENKNEQELLIEGYKEEDVGIADLNANNLQNYNQSNQVYQEKGASIINSQAESDLLDFGPTIEEQIHRQAIQEKSHNKEYDKPQDQPQHQLESIPMKIQTGFKKEIDMEIESQSKGYLTEKESHKSNKIYHQRQIEWDKHQEYKSKHSQASDNDKIPFYEQEMPQNNSNLFKFGFTITSRKKNSSQIKNFSQSVKLELVKADKSQQKSLKIEKTQINQLSNQTTLNDKKQQQKKQSSNSNVILEASPKSLKRSQINAIQQQIYFQNNNSPKKQIYQNLEKGNQQGQIQEIKDQLPSQIPPDQFQVISNSCKDQRVPQIEFESISAISNNDKPNQIKTFEVQAILENNSSQKQNIQNNSSETIKQQLINIHNNKNLQGDDYNFQLLQNLLKKHINLITLRPIDSIGQEILENGEYLMLFIDLFVLTSSAGENRNLFQKYLSYSLAHNVQVNKQIYQNYKQRFWPSKNEKFTITDCFNLKNSPKKQQRTQSQHEIQQRYSVEVHDTSVHQGLRSIMKSNNKPKIKQPRTEMPVQRNANNIRKSLYNHQEEKQTKHTIVNETLQKEKKPKQTKRRVKTKKQDTPEKNQKLGFAQTFVTIEDKNGNQILQTRKVSLRLLEKSNRQKSHSKQIKKSMSRQKKRSPQKQQIRQTTQQYRRNSPKPSARKRGAKSIRRSVARTQNQSQILTADYVKSHFQELKIDAASLKMLTGTLLTQADQQIAKMLEQYQKATKQQERLALDLQASHQVPPLEQPHTQIDQDTHNPVSLQRIREIEQQLQKNKLKKYKILQQLTQNHIVIDTIIDPDINNHGIYALVKVSKMTSVFCGALYFLIPMSKLELCSRDRIDEDIKTIKSLVQESEKDNIGILKPSLKIQHAIQAQKINKLKLQKKN